LLGVLWVVVLSHHEELVLTPVSSDGDGSVLSVSVSDHELNVVTQWLSWPFEGGLVNVPSLVETVVAVPEDNVSVVVVVSTVNVQTFSTVVSNVSSGSTVPGESLVDLGSPWSDSSSNSDPVTLSLLVGNGVVSSGEGSDSSGSGIEDEPLLVVPWGVVSDSKSVLVSTNVLGPEEGSSGWHE